ncbi:MAG: NnrU family protein [Pseudomonadota bacterium]
MVGDAMTVAIAMLVFVASHIVIARTGLKTWLTAKLGHRGYLAGYSLLSVVLLGWVIAALLAAPRMMLWPAPAWSWGFAAIVSLLGFVLMGIGALTPNPLSVGFREAGFDPGRPGVVGWVRHPLLLGLTLWAIAHVPANGDWPSLALFGASALFGLLGMRRVSQRKRKQLGPERWASMTASHGHLDRRAVVGALAGSAFWTIALVAHSSLFGANPLAVLRAQLGVE